MGEVTREFLLQLATAEVLAAKATSFLDERAHAYRRAVIFRKAAEKLGDQQP